MIMSGISLSIRRLTNTWSNEYMYYFMLNNIPWKGLMSLNFLLISDGNLNICWFGCALRKASIFSVDTSHSGITESSGSCYPSFWKLYIASNRTRQFYTIAIYEGPHFSQSSIRPILTQYKEGWNDSSFWVLQTQHGVSALAYDEPKWAAWRQPVLTPQHDYGTSAAFRHLCSSEFLKG